MLDTKMANAIDSTASACAFTLYEREPDRLEQIRGAAVDPTHGQLVVRCLEGLLSHRADCRHFVDRSAPGSWLQAMVGAQTRRAFAAMGRPPGRFAARWVREHP